MGYVEGVWWSLAAAVAHSLIDVLRKLGSQKMAPLDLVALVTVYDALFATLGVLAVEGTLPDPSTFTNKTEFLIVVLITASIAVLARLLYQKALSTAPLSLTVPYLAFTPAFVVLVSPMFLVGEVPSPLGMLGVFIVSISGYMLGLIATPSTGEQPSSPSKAKLPLVVSSMHKTVPGGALQQQSQQDYIAQNCHDDMQLTNLQSTQHAKQQRQQQHSHTAGDQQHWRMSSEHSSKKGHTGSRSSQLSVWAMAYYKGKSQQPFPSSVLCDGDLSQPTHTHWLSSSDADVKIAADVLNGSHSAIMNGAMHRGRTAVDSQAKICKDYKADKAAGTKPTAAIKAAKLLTDAISSKAGTQRFTTCFAVSGPNAAPAMVLTVAFLYSVTASLDKLGIAAAGHNLAAYLLGQRLLLGLFGLVYLLSFGRSALRHVLHDMVLLVGISLSELGAVVFYLIAINNILVSYVVAIKRVNVLLSTLVGCVLFKEHVRNRIPYIMAMLCGMLMIVLQPGHEDLHHSHHTRHHQHHLL